MTGMSTTVADLVSTDSNWIFGGPKTGPSFCVYDNHYRLVQESCFFARMPLISVSIAASSPQRLNLYNCAIDVIDEQTISGRSLALAYQVERDSCISALKSMVPWQ
jgi:hypothetical protein